jgi:hypothetical protein
MAALDRRPDEEACIYEIRFRGSLHERWFDWFDGFTIASLPEGETLLRGNVVDQAELFGVLTRLRDLNLELISVNLMK